MNLSTLILEASELAKAIHQTLPESICIVDLSSEQSYLYGHIPGAVHLPFQALLCGQAPVPGKIAPLEQLERIFSYLGLNDDTHFIVYDDEGGGWAGRFIWTLDAIGHSKYSYLNGGIHAWKKANLPLEQISNQRNETQVSLSIKPEVVIEIPDILDSLEKQSCHILDARSPEEYSGQRVLTQKSGHMPGAIHCEWTSLMDEENGLIIRRDAKEYLASLGLDGSKPIITHCQSHHRSGFTYLVGLSLGLDIRGYHGSWSEWGNSDNTPVEI